MQSSPQHCLPMQTGATGAIIASGEIVPVHQMTDAAVGLPWLVTTSPAFGSASLPGFHRLSLTTSCPSSKRNAAPTLFGSSASRKFPEVVLGDVLGLGLQVLDFTMSYMPSSVPFMQSFPAPSPPSAMSMSPGNGTVMHTDSAMIASVEVDNDPVTKAVMDNVMGRIPTKKPKLTVRCDVCNLEFYSQSVLDSHLSGSKHQRKMKSADLMKTLQETETGFERDEVSGVIRCVVCDVTVNSPQLLATHIAGNKHKQRAAKRSTDPNNTGTNPPQKKTCLGFTDQMSMDVDVSNSNGGPQGPVNTPRSTTTSNLEIPDCVTKLEDTKGGGKFLCNLCQAHCNSEQQLAQHLSSKKHLDKLSGRKPRGGGNGGGGGGWRARRRPAFRGRGRGRGRPSHTYTQPLSSSFVSGGALL